jgi:GT2 family glycosyltransferase
MLRTPLTDEPSSPRPLVSVVVATYEDVELTSRCLASLEAQTYSPLEIIVVDNGSADDLGARLSGEFPRCIFLRNERNSGFAGGYNRGMREATGRYITILNNDAVADPDWVAAMVDVAVRHPDVGAVAAVVVDGYHPDVLDSHGLGIALDGMSRQVGSGAGVDEALPETEVFAASGCACLYDAPALERVGLFDESFFAYCEDVDLALRLRWAGYSIVLAPRARVLHYHSRTTGRFSARKVFWVERNHFWLGLKNFPAALLVLMPLVTVWRYALQARAVLAHRGEVDAFTSELGMGALVIAVLSAYVSCIAGLPRVWRQRREIIRSARTPWPVMARNILRFRLSMSEVLRSGGSPVGPTGRARGD